MNKIRVKKSHLLLALQENRDEHREEFAKAQTRYRERVIEALDTNLASAKAGRKIITYIRLPVPEDHTEDYDAAIEALEWEVADEVELDQREFNTLVRNQWSWAEAFASNTQAYTTGALS